MTKLRHQKLKMTGKTTKMTNHLKHKMLYISTIIIKNKKNAEFESLRLHFHNTLIYSVLCFFKAAQNSEMTTL